MLVVFLVIGAYVVYRVATSAPGANTPGARMSPSTPLAISSDLAELPRDVRDYVMSFVVDPASLAEDFDDGADALERGCVAGGKVGVDYFISSSAETFNASSTSLPSEPTLTMTPTSAPSLASTAPTTSFSPSSSATAIPGAPVRAVSPATAIPGATSRPAGSTWCYPRAAARLRAIAAEKRAGLGDTIVSAGLAARAMMSSASVTGAYAFGMRSCETSPMATSWTCCQCRRALRNSISTCPNCEHRRCG